jgi:hypothetical protein
MAQRRVIAMVEIQLLYEILSSVVNTGLQANRCLPTVRTSRCNPMKNPLVRDTGMTRELVEPRGGGIDNHYYADL